MTMSRLAGAPCVNSFDGRSVTPVIGSPCPDGTPKGSGRHRQQCVLVAIRSRPHAEQVKVAYLLYPGFTDRTSSSPVTVGEATCLPLRARNAVNSPATLSAPAHAQGGGEAPSESRGHLVWIVAGSLATGLVAALVLAAAPFISAEESALTGALLCGFAVGWATL